MANIVLGITIRADGTAEVRRELGGVRDDLNNAGNAANGANRMFADMAGQLKGLFAIGSSLAIAKEIFDVNRHFQSLRTNLANAVGGLKNAGLAFGFVEEFASQTPFEVDQVTEAFITLKNMGLTPSEEALRSYGNTASSQSKPIMQMIEAVADATMGEFERLKEFGINAESVGDNVAFTFQGVRTTVANESAEIEKYLIKLGNTKFGNAMADQAKTIDGALSNLGDGWQRFIDHILDSSSESAIGKWIQNLGGWIDWLDLKINGATGNAAKLAEINARISSNKDSLAAHNSNGMIGGLIDDLAGYDANLTKNRIDADLKEREKIIKAMHDEKAAQKELIDGIGKNGASAAAASKAEKERAEAAKKSAKDAESAAKQHTTAEKNRRDSVMETIAALQSELEINRLGAQDKALQTELRQKLAKAVGIEREQITALVEQIHAENAARETQKAMWEALIADANALDKLKDDAGDAVRLANLAEELKLQGLNNQAIKDRIDLEKQIATAIADNPDLDPEQVKRYVTERTAAEQRLQQLTDDSSKASAEAMETAFKRAIENIQDSFAQMFETLLNHDAIGSFETFFDNIRRGLNKAISQQLSIDLQNLLTGKGGAGSLAKSALVFGAGMAVSLFGKDEPTRTFGPAATGNSKVIGTGAMHIADSFGRDLGFEYQSQTAAEFNRSLTWLSDTIMDSAGNITTWIGTLGNKLASISVVQQVASFFKPVTSLIGQGMSYIGNIYSGLMNLVNGGINAVTNAVGLTTAASGALVDAISSGAAGTGTASAAAGEAAANVGINAMQNVAGALAVLKLGFDLYSTWSDDALTTHKKITNSLWAMSDTLLSASAIYGNWMMAAGAAVLNLGGVISDAFENGFNRENIGRLILGPLAGLFMKQRTPNAWMNTYSPGGGDYQYNPGAGTYTATGNKSAYVGEATPFGMTVISTHELSMTTDEMQAAFGRLLKTVKFVDVNLYDAINHIDQKYGQAGATMDYYNRLLSDGNPGVSSVATQQNTNELNTGGMLLDRYQWIMDQLAMSGTEAGKYVNAWFDVITNKFISASKDNAIMVLGIVDSLATNLESFMAFPLELVDLLGNSVKSVQQGGTPESVMAEIAGIIDTFMMVKTGFKQMNMDVDGGRIATFLAHVNAIGYGVAEAGTNLLSYAIALQKTNGQIAASGNELMDAIQRKFDGLKGQGLDNSQMNAYFGSFGLFANLFAEAKVAFTEADLDYAAGQIHALSKASTEAAQNVIDHAIATEQLTHMSRDAAIATLIKNGKLDEATVAEAEYGVSIQNTTKDIMAAMGFVQQLGYITGQSLGEMGVSAATWQAAAKNVVAVFGDLEKAAQTFDGIAKTFLSANEYAVYNLATIDRSLANMREANPDLAGLNESSITAALKSGEAMASFINQMAQGNGELAKTTLDYVQLVGQRMTIEKELVDAYEQNLKAVKSAVDQVKTQYARLNGSELQNQLWGLQDSFLSTIATVISNGGKLADVMDTVDIALKAGTDALDKAKASLKATFDGIYAAIGQARTGVSDAIVNLTNKSDLQRIQKERAWADLNSSNYETQMAAVTTLQNMIMQGYDDQAAAVDQMANSIKQMKSYVDGLKVNSQLSPLSHQGRLDESRAQFNAQLALAKAGDKDALANISKFVDTYLGEAKNFYASSTAYADIFANVTDALSGLTQSPTLTPEQQTAEATKSAVDELKSINAVLDTIQKQQEKAQADQLSQMDSQAQSIKQDFIDALYDMDGASAVLTQDLVNNILSLRSELADLIMNIDFTANLPEDLQNLMVMASNSFTVSVDLVLDPASTLTPEEKAIAVGITKNSIAKLALLLDPASTLTEAEKTIATTALMNSAVLLNMSIDPASTLTAEEKAIATGTANTYQTLVDIQFSNAYDATAKALALATENTINTAVKVALDPGYDSEAKQIAIATANSINAAVKVAMDPASSLEAKTLALNTTNALNAAVKAVMDPASSPEAKALALNNMNMINSMVKVMLDPASSQDAKALALNATNAINATVKAAMDPASSPEAKALALATENTISTAVKVGLDPGYDSEAKQIALATTNSISAMVKVTTDPASSQDAKALALNTENSINTVVKALMDPAGSADAKALALNNLNTINSMVKAMLDPLSNDTAKLLALETQNTINTAVKVSLDPNYDADAKLLALTTSNTLNTAVKVMLDPASDSSAKQIATETANSINASVKALMDPASSNDAKALAINSLNTLNASVKAVMDVTSSAEAKALATNSINSINASVKALLDNTSNADAKKLALNTINSISASVKAVFDPYSNTSAQSVATKTSNTINSGVIAKFDATSSSDAQKVALAAATNANATLNVSSTLTLDTVLNNSILSYSKADVKSIYESMNWGILAIESHLKSAKSNSPFIVKSSNQAGGSLAMFAKGGITNKPAIFGEAGWEAAVPLPDGRTIPVTVKGAPAETSKETEQLLNRILAELQAANKQRGQIATATIKQNDRSIRQSEAQTRAIRRTETT